MSEAPQGLRDFLQAHRRVVVLTGAGCSVPSGIPDYRGHDGARKRHKPMTFAQFTGSASARRRYGAGSLRDWPRVRDARPNAVHAARERGLLRRGVDDAHSSLTDGQTEAVGADPLVRSGPARRWIGRIGQPGERVVYTPRVTSAQLSRTPVP